MRIFTLAISLALLAAAPARAQDEPAGAEGRLPLSRVVLFTSGVGYFQRDGAVTGDATVELRFDAADVNDLLKSLVVRDRDGGTITGVNYTSRDPVAKTLRSFAIDLTKNPTLAQILDQVRGEAVEIGAPNVLQGTIVGVETRKVPAGDETVEKEVLNLLTDKGMVSIALDEVGGIRFVRPGLEKELRQALATLALSHDTQKKTVALRFAGEGRRRVRVAYIAESPVWKTSYRLVLAEGEQPLLQGWAIVENTSDEDWDDVRLTLVSGRPISFIMDLYQPLYVERPVVEPELYRSLRPQKYAEAIELLEAEEERARSGAPAAPAGAARRARKAEAGKALDRDAGAEGADFLGGIGASAPSLAQAGEVGELFQYDIATPVSLPRQQSALLPIVNAPVKGEKVSIYNASVHPKHPLNGLRLENTTSVHLMQGPITVFDGGAYAGDAQIDDLEPGGKRLVSYAMDLDTEVEQLQKGGPQTLVSVKVTRGVLIATRKFRAETVYNVRNRGGRARRVLVEHPFASDWELVAPKEPHERTREVYRFALDVPAGGKESLSVVLERQIDQTISLRNVSDETIELYLKAREVGEDVKAVLRETMTRKDALAKTDAEIKRRQDRVREIAQEQARIRDNMARLSQSSQLYQRYVAKLTSQEDELETLREETQELEDQRARQQRALDEYLMSLE